MNTLGNEIYFLKKALFTKQQKLSLKVHGRPNSVRKNCSSNSKSLINPFADSHL